MSEEISKPTKAFFASCDEGYLTGKEGSECNRRLLVFTNKKEDNGRYVYYQKEVSERVKCVKYISGPKRGFDYTQDTIILYESKEAYYICFRKPKSSRDKYSLKLCTINQVPKAREKIEVAVSNSEISIFGFYFNYFVPDVIYDEFAEYGLYILKYNSVYYFCTMR